MVERRRTYQDANGVRRTIISDTEDPSKFVVHTEQVLDELLDGVMRDRELVAARGGRAKDIEHAARIPVEIYEMMIREGWGPDDEAKWLNSSAAEPFRIWKGRV